MHRNKASLIALAVIVLLTAVLAGVIALRTDSKKQDAEPIPEAVQTEEPAVIQPTPSPEPTPEPEPAFAAGIYKGSYEQMTELYGMQYLDYNVVVPKNATEGMPLLIYLPGDNSNDRVDTIPTWELPLRVKEYYGDEFPFIMLLPCTRWFEWHDGWIAEVLKGMMDKVAEEYAIDPERVMLTGYSRGAVAAWQYVEDFGDYFCCTVPVSCGAKIHDFEPFRDVPVWAMYGEGEYDSATYGPDIRYNVNMINENGGDARFTTVPNADHSDMGYAAYTKDVIEWMLEQ